jgi:hypothetical protein
MATYCNVIHRAIEQGELAADEFQIAHLYRLEEGKILKRNESDYSFKIRGLSFTKQSLIAGIALDDGTSKSTFGSSWLSKISMSNRFSAVATKI